MMQEVATAKSDIAAFAIGKESNTFKDSGSQVQFGKFLHDQKTTNSEVVEPQVSLVKAPSKTSSPQPRDEVNNAPAIVAEKDLSKQNNQAKAESGGITKDPIATIPQDKSVTEGEENIEIEVQNGNSQPSDQLAALNQSDKKSIDNAAKVVAEDWVLLVDNLKRLAGIDASPISSSPELDPDVILSDNAENVSFVRMGDDSFADNTRVSLDGFILPTNEDSKNLDGLVLVTKKQLEQTSTMQDADSVPKAEAILTNTLTNPNTSEVVDKALAEVLASSKLMDLPKTEITDKTAEILLKKPDVLLEMMNELQAMSQKTGVSDQNTGERAMDSPVQKDPMLASQQLEKLGQADLSLNENKILLKTLVVETETATKINDIQIPIKTAKTGLTDTAEKLIQNQQAEIAISKVASSIAADELIKPDVQVSPVVTVSPLKVNEVDKTKPNSDIKNILNLSEDKQIKVLENITQRVFENSNTSLPISSEQLARQVITPKTTEVGNPIESTSKDFIAALKSGLEEFKSQLSQGREPGLDLKALVAEALAKSTDPATTAVAKTSVNLEQIVNNVSQVLNLAQTMRRTIEERQDQVYSATLRDVAQVQGEQSKSLQFNQLEAKFEKAVNITKPEGHQQLAEKVRWMVNTKNLVADIRLDPAELGSVHVKVAVSGESATVNFVVQSQQARDAVDNATPKLREMLAEKGIELGQSSVEQENNGQTDQEGGQLSQHGRQGHDVDAEIEATDSVLAQQSIVNGALGGIDYFV